MNYHTLGDLIDAVYSALAPRIGTRAASLAVTLLVGRFDALTVSA